MPAPQTERSPVKYIVKELSLVGNELFQAGATCEYAGLPAENLEPTDDEGRARYQGYLDSNDARVKKMIADNATSAVGDPAAFAEAMAKAQQDQSAIIGAAVAAGIAEAFARLFPNGLQQLAAPVVTKATGKAGKSSDPDSLA